MTDTPSISIEAKPHALQARSVRLLGDLADEARAIAGALARRVMAIDADEDLSHAEAVPLLEGLSRAHGRASRAVRLSLMLQVRMAEGLEDRDRRSARDAERAAFLARVDHTTQVYEQAERLAGVVGRIAQAEQMPPDEVERLVAEARERLDDEDVHGDILSRPMSEWVALICQDLGLDPDWPTLAGEAWATAEAAGADVGWPLKSLPSPGALGVGPSEGRLQGGANGLGDEAGVEIRLSG